MCYQSTLQISATNGHTNEQQLLVALPIQRKVTFYFTSSILLYITWVLDFKTHLQKLKKKKKPVF